MSYRPITDVWILARSKVPFYGAYPAGFLHRARALLGVGILDPVLHVCAGSVLHYPYAGFGPNDRTLDINPSLSPDFLQDVMAPLPSSSPFNGEPWKAVLADPPYTSEDARHYGEFPFPDPNRLLYNCLQVVSVGNRVGMLHYLWPHPGKLGKEVAVVAVGTGRNGRARWFTVFERLDIPNGPC